MSIPTAQEQLGQRAIDWHPKTVSHTLLSSQGRYFRHPSHEWAVFLSSSPLLSRLLEGQPAQLLTAAQPQSLLTFLTIVPGPCLAFWNYFPSKSPASDAHSRLYSQKSSNSNRHRLCALDVQLPYKLPARPPPCTQKKRYMVLWTPVNPVI